MYAYLGMVGFCLGVFCKAIVLRRFLFFITLFLTCLLFIHQTPDLLDNLPCFSGVS